MLLQNLAEVINVSGAAPSGAKALLEKKGLIAAPKALLHPEASFSANYKAPSFYGPEFLFPTSAKACYFFCASRI
jgi:hypothetical protein